MSRTEKWKRLDEDILSSLPCTVHYVPFKKEDGMCTWLFVGFLHKIALYLAKFIKNNMTINAFASSKINILYYYRLQRVKERYDLVLGYSGMYYPAFLYAAKQSIPFAFDMEDYHPGEVIYHVNKGEEVQRRIKMFKSILPKASYVSYGSPLIEEKTTDLLKQNRTSIPKGFALNNTFRYSDFSFTACNDNRVHFVWFSQTISYGRGIDLILPVLNLHKDKVRLTLIGNMDNNFYKKVLSQYESFLDIKEALPQSNLHKEIGCYDIGLALEQTVDENKSLCLSNKIFAYLLSGLYVIATSTKAQAKLMSSLSHHGVVVDSTAENLAQCVKDVIDHIHTIREDKEKRFNDIACISWESEEKKLTDVWAKLID